MSETMPPPVIHQPEMTPPPMSGMATASLVCGILAIPTCLSCVPAIITGHLAMSQIKASQGRIGGRGAAKAGLILGYLTMGLYVMILVVAMAAGIAAPLVLRQREKANLVESMNNMRQISVGLMEYQSRQPDDGPAFPADIHQLESSGITTNIDHLLSISKPGGEWIYFPGADPKDPSATLLVSPAFGQKTAVLSVDMSVKAILSSSVESLLTSQASPPVTIPAPQR